ncbi:hypothetical protein LCGC14_1218100 [marine sediment metagenome]|uniref:Uncharacterized protein n=1 Tax=marine sediment metagenome TaxID=412755 RepID=A0A0F9NUC8_9ZZZZ
MNYILDEHGEPKAEPNPQAWAEWIEANKGYRKVARDTVKYPVQQADVSTIFLGIDHPFGEGPPLLFETIVFGGSLNDKTVRYSTRAEALEGHAAMVKRIQGPQPKR